MMLVYFNQNYWMSSQERLQSAQSPLGVAKSCTLGV